MTTPQIILNLISLIFALTILVYSYFMVFYTLQTINFHSKIFDLILPNPFSKNQGAWCQKKWVPILFKIFGVIAFLFTLLCLTILIHNIIIPK